MVLTYFLEYSSFRTRGAKFLELLHFLAIFSIIYFSYFCTRFMVHICSVFHSCFMAIISYLYFSYFCNPFITHACVVYFICILLLLYASRCNAIGACDNVRYVVPYLCPCRISSGIKCWINRSIDSCHSWQVTEAVQLVQEPAVSWKPFKNA